MKRLTCIAFALLLLAGSPLVGQTLEPIVEVEPQPLKAQARRVAQALEFLGQPLTKSQQASLKAALAETDKEASVKKIQAVLD